MFTIIGADGKEYGPATTGQVRAWIGGGRANLQTQARAIGSEEWRTLGDFPEFGAPGVVPPPLPGGPSVAGALAQIGPRAADRGARTGAALINAAFYFMAMMPGSLVMTRQLLAQNPDLAKGGFPRMDEVDLTGFREAALWVWFGLLAAIAVQCILLAVRSQNIGKMFTGARVVRVADDQPAGWVRAALLRFLVPVTIVMALNILFPLGCFFLIIDYAFMFRADQRCLHDLIAGTRVIRA